MSKIEFGKGTAYLSIEAVVNMFAGYAFWFVLSKITTSEIIGTSSAVISLTIIITSIVTIGVPSGIQRFLGRSFAEQKIEDTKIFVEISLLLVSIGVICCIIIIFIIKNWMYNVFHVDFSLLVVSILIIAASAIAALFRSIVIASLKTRILTTAAILTTVSRLALAIGLVSMGTGALGIIIGYTSIPVLTTILLTITIIVTIFRSSKSKSEVRLIHSIKKIWNASIAFWIPGLITTFGSQLGTVVVLGSHGASQAGIYFIALSIVTGITLLSSALSTIAYPTISAMQDGRKRFAWRITKLALIVTFPLSSAFMFYSIEIMQLFGKSYIEGAPTLEILLLTILPGAVTGSVGLLVYSYGNNKQVLLVGLALSIPRIVFYFMFVPYYGSIGAAVSYSAGAVIAAIVSFVIAKKVGMQIIWKDLAIISIIPSGFAFVLSNIGINYIVGVIATIILSYILFLKLRIINRFDLQDGVAVLPSSIAKPTFNILFKLAKRLDRSY